jgi:hypothetical protein
MKQSDLGKSLDPNTQLQCLKLALPYRMASILCIHIPARTGGPLNTADQQKSSWLDSVSIKATKSSRSFCIKLFRVSLNKVFRSFL